MSTLLAIDPSLTCTGWAIFRDNDLTRCGFVATSADCSTPQRFGQLMDRFAAARTSRSDPPPDQVVIEWPQIYRSAPGKTKGQDPNDLLLVAGAATAILAGLDYVDTRLVHPATWKGQVPKAIHNERVKAKLTPAERKILQSCGVSARLENNVVDAIGIGLWALGR